MFEYKMVQVPRGVLVNVKDHKGSDSRPVAKQPENRCFTMFGKVTLRTLPSIDTVSHLIDHGSSCRTLSPVSFRTWPH